MSGLAACQASSQRVSISSIRTADSFLGVQVDQLVQRVGGAARPAGRGAGQDEPAHPRRVPDGQLLGHHAAEGDAEHEAVVPADGVEQRGGVVGEVRHGVRPGRHAALPQAALVVGQDLEVLGQGAVAQLGRCWRRSPPVPEMKRSRSPVPSSS